MSVGFSCRAVIIKIKFCLYAVLLKELVDVFCIDGRHGIVAGVVEQHNIFVAAGCPALAQVAMVESGKQRLALLGIEIHHIGGQELRQPRHSYKGVHLRTSVLFA